MASEIQAWVQTYYPDFYTALVAQESWTYANYSGDASALAAWHTYFANLMTAMNNWKAATRAPRSADKGRDIIQAIYGYTALHTAYGTSFGSINLMDAYVIYNMDGFVDSTLTNPVNWYNDMIVVGGPPPYTSVRMDASIALVTASVTSPVENNAFDAAVDAAKVVVGNFGVGAMFTDYTPTGTPISKTAQKDYIYDTLNYLAVGTAVTTTGIPLPPFPLP